MRSALLSLLASLLWFPAVLAGQEPAPVRGIVTDAHDRPLSGVLVRVEKRYVSTTTDEAGRFRLDLPQGLWHLRFRRIGYEEQARTVEIPGEAGTLRIRLRARPVELKGLSVKGERGDVLRETVTRQTVRQAPPLVEPDVFRALVFQPGVTQPNDLKGRIHLAGGASDETGVRLDGHPLQDPFHVLGILGAFNVAALDRAEVRMHHLPVDTDDYLSGVIDLKTRTGSDDRYEVIGSLLASSVTTLQPDLTAGFDVLASGRITYADRLAPLISNEIPQLGYYDGLLRVGRDFGEGWRGEVLGFTNQNYLRGGDIRGDEPVRPLQWGENLLGLRLTKRDGDWTAEVRGSTNSAGTFLDERPDGARQIDSDLDRHSVGLQLTRRSGAWKGGIGVSLDHRSHRQEWIGLGSSELVSPSVPEAFEGQEKRTVAALFGRGSLALGDGLEVEGGLRVSSSEGGTYLAPRLRLNWLATEALSLSVAANRRHQFTAMIEEPIEGNISPPRFLLDEPRVADVFGIGVDWSAPRMSVLGEGLHLSADLFWKDYNDRPLLVREPGDEPAEPFPLFERIKGSGYGALVSVKLPLGERGTFQGSYAYQRAREELRGETFNTDWDAPHGLSLFASLPLATSWSLNTALQYRSGSATTPIRGLLVRPAPFGATVASPLYGKRNDGHLPPYFRLDLGVRHEWRWLDASWAFFGQVLNTTFHENEFEPDLRGLLGFGGGDTRSGLPMLPSFGVEVRW